MKPPWHLGHQTLRRLDCERCTDTTMLPKVGIFDRMVERMSNVRHPMEKLGRSVRTTQFQKIPLEEHPFCRFLQFPQIAQFTPFFLGKFSKIATPSGGGTRGTGRVALGSAGELRPRRRLARGARPGSTVCAIWLRLPRPDQLLLVFFTPGVLHRPRSSRT